VGSWGQAGVDRVVCEGSWIVVDNGGQWRVVLQSRRRVLLNASARSRVAPSAG
jgi:hypothetical protein